MGEDDIKMIKSLVKSLEEKKDEESLD